MRRTVVAQQGEVKVFRIDAIPAVMNTRLPGRSASGAAIVAHSESGNHHVIADAEVMERVDNVPAGMKIFYAICKNPTALRQDAPNPHGKVPLDVGLYELRVSREFDPFAEQIRTVAD